jgi:hypothetical protein
MKSDHKCIWEYAKDKKCTCTECQYCSYYQKEKHKKGEN